MIYTHRLELFVQWNLGPKIWLQPEISRKLPKNFPRKQIYYLPWEPSQFIPVLTNFGLSGLIMMLSIFLASRGLYILISWTCALLEKPPVVQLLKNFPKVHYRVHKSPLWHFVTSSFFGEELLASRSTPNLEGHPFSAVRYYLFNIFAATLHIWRPSPPSATWGRAMPWWQGTYVTWPHI
jgi:hypothetical protein